MNAHEPIKLICCWCVPSHVMREGTEPASHGLCEKALAAFKASPRVRSFLGSGEWRG